MYLSRVSKDKQVPFCRALNYIYRPTAFEHYCPYKFFQTIKVVKKAEAKNCESFDFTDTHPKRAIITCIYRSSECVPNIDWTFFGDANKLQSPLFENTYRNYRYCDIDEEHARKYLIGFSAFRDEKDLQLYNSYKKRINKCHENGEFQEFHDIMQNIQNIRNSLDAGRMNDDIPSIEIDDENTDQLETEGDDVQNMIATYFASTTNTSILDKEPDEFEFKKPDFVNSGADEGDIWEGPPQKVFMHRKRRKRSRCQMEQNSRQFCSLYGMNSLLKKTFIMDSSDDATTPKITPNGTVESIIAYGLSRKFDLDQQTAFEILTSTLVLTYVEDVYLTNKSSNEDNPSEAFVLLSKVRNELRSMAQIETRNNKPLRMFLTGPAGAGKCKLSPHPAKTSIFFTRKSTTNVDTAKILNGLMDYAQEYICQLDGFQFDQGIIRLTALTGSAATEIRGSTVHRVCKLGASSKIDTEDIERWLNSRLLIIDEVSFACHDKILKKLSVNLQKFTSTYDEMYGSMNICFIGDFLQLEPTAGRSAYSFPESIYWENALNCMVELKGMWRFKKCPQLLRAFPILRSNGMTEELRELFNSRVVGTVSEDGKKLEMPDIRFTKVATYSNKNRESANRCIFDEHVQKYHSMDKNAPIPDFTIIIKGFMNWDKQQHPLTYTERNGIFSNTTETDFKQTRNENKRCDPFLRLFYQMHVMSTDNEDVDNGIANGTTALFEYLVLKDGKHVHKIRYNKYWVFAVNAEDIEYMQLRWHESTFKGTFQLRPKRRKYTVSLNVSDFGENIRITPKIEILTFLLTPNHATTGHKLQGKTVDSLIVREWTKQRNWLYVVLSRVTTLNGLFLLEPIPKDIETQPCNEFVDMMSRLRCRISAKIDSAEIERIRYTVRNLM